MKHYLILAAVLFTIACGSNKTDSDTVKEEEVVEEAPTMAWRAELDGNTGKLLLAKDKPVMYDTLNVDRVIELMNSLYPNIQARLDKISNDTVFINIPNANYLTQQMGSTGPTVYFADIVFNLTEMQGVRYVSFSFEEGDHASPGILSKESIRKDFEPIIK